MIRSTFKHIINRLGFNISRINKDIITIDHPGELKYLKELNFSLTHLPVSKGVGLRFYNLNPKNSYHPYILALQAKKPAEIRERLEIYSKCIQMPSAEHYFGLQNEVFDESSNFFKWIYPWSNSGLTGKKLEKIYKAENSRFNLNKPIYLESEEFSSSKIDIEFYRLTELKNSIDKHGLKMRVNDPINGYILVKDGEWKWFVESGQHRAAVLSQNGCKFIPVHVTKIIDRSDVEYWPNVKAGIIETVNALEIFDSLFGENLPDFVKDWEQYVRKLRM